jgi:membrane peptidoglycan carboxypeptidase
MSGGVWCPPTPIVEVLDREGKKVDVAEQPCEQAVAEGLANTLVVGMGKDHVGSGTASRAAGNARWTRPMLGKTGTTQNHMSAGFVGATPQLAAANLTFDDSTAPQGICVGDPPRRCGRGGDIFGGRTPAQTWFEAMSGILAGQPELPLPPTDPRYVDGGPESKVPNVKGRSQQEATDILQNAGYKVVAKSRNDAAKKGIVVSQTPLGSALAGETITIYVSTGYVPPPQTSDPPVPPTDPPGNGGGPGGGGNGGGGGGGGGGRGDPDPGPEPIEPIEPIIGIPNPRP